MNYYSYVKLTDESAAESFKSKLNQYIQNDFGDEMTAEGFKMSFAIAPISEMHFDTSIGSDYPEKISKELLYSLVAIAAFILLIACINYINLSTAKSEKRPRKWGFVR